jgi:hypothetical protein
MEGTEKRGEEGGRREKGRGERKAEGRVIYHSSINYTHDTSVYILNTIYTHGPEEWDARKRQAESRRAQL